MIIPHLSITPDFFLKKQADFWLDNAYYCEAEQK